MRQKLLLIGAVFFGFMAFILTYRQIDGEKRRLLGDTETVHLIQVRRNMVDGEELRDNDLKKITVKRQRDKMSISREIPWSELSRVVGRKLETSVAAGQILLSTDLKPMSRRQGFTGIIGDGFRAVSIPVDAVSSVSNLVRPGDNVDVIGTFRFPEQRGNTSLDTVTLTLLQNVKVIAVGSRWQSVINEQPNTRANFATVTLQLLPQEVEIVIFASQKGRLSLSLRSYEDCVTDKTVGSRSINFQELEKKIPKINLEREKKRHFR